jgi:hypothetical protein
MNWARILAFITGTVEHDLLRIEYLVGENRILKAQLKGRLFLSDAERATLGEIGHRLGRKALADVANAARPDTILGTPPRVAQRLYHEFQLDADALSVPLLLFKRLRDLEAQLRALPAQFRQTQTSVAQVRN